MTMPLSELIAEARREVKMREHVYARRVEERQMSPAAAERQIRAMQEIADALQRLADHMPLFRTLAKEVRIIQQHPEVQAVLDTFPDAQVTAIRDTNQGEMPV